MKENKKAILEILKKKSKKDGKFESLVLNLALQKIDSDSFEFYGDAVYTADPKKDPQSQRYHRISFDEAIGRNLAVLDSTAFALCRDQKLPINVFSIFKAGALKRVVMGEDEGTLVHS